MTADYAITITTKLLQRDLKIMNKIGISTLHSYQRCPNFEILGLNKNLLLFPIYPSRIEGIGLIEVEKKLKKDIRKHFQTRVSPAFISRNWYLQMEKNRREAYV
jgi:glutamate synthase (ferredoxin)